MTEKELYASIRVIDSELSTIIKRLDNINDNLKSGIFGETPKDTDDEADSMPSESIASITKRVESIQRYLNTIEEYVNRIHISGDTKSSS